MSVGLGALLIIVTQVQADGGLGSTWVSTITEAMGQRCGELRSSCESFLWKWYMSFLLSLLVILMLCLTSEKSRAVYPIKYLKGRELCFATGMNDYHVSCQNYDKNRKLLGLLLRCPDPF